MSTSTTSAGKEKEGKDETARRPAIVSATVSAKDCTKGRS